MTYSIVARDKKTGEFGVAVQSHYFQVSPAVPWALAGVGAVATQSQVNISYGPLGLDLLQAGYTAEQALKALTSGDPQAEVRQCAIVDATGAAAAHTGSKCIPAAGHRVGDGFSCQANLMEKDTVWDAMTDAYLSTEAPLAERMMAALEAAEAERIFDAGDKAAADAKADEAIRMAPEMVEIRFWTGLEMAINGEVDRGVDLMSGVVREKGERWVETLRRLAIVDRVPADLAKTIEARLAAKVGSK